MSLLLNNIDIDNIGGEKLLKLVEDEIKTVNATDKKNWVKMYELLKLVKDKEIWTAHEKATSFSSWVRFFSKESKIHETILWNRYRAGEVYSNYTEFKQEQGETYIEIDKLSVSPDLLVLLEKINKHAPALAQKISDRVMKGKMKRKELTVLYEAIRPKKPNYNKCGKIIHTVDIDDSIKEDTENKIAAAEILAALSNMSWVGFKDNKGFKGSIRQENEEQKLQKDKAYSIAEFPVFSGTSQKSRRIDLLGIENITKDHHEKYELNLHGVEIKVSKSDLERDIKYPEYGEFVDFLWLAIPSYLLETAKSIKADYVGILIIDKGCDVKIHEQAQRIMNPPLRHKALETAVLKLI